MENQNLLNEPLLQLGATSFTLGNILLAGIVVLVLCLAIFLIAAARSARLRAVAEAQAEDRARDAEYRMAEILKAQAEMQGRMQTMAEVFGSRQAELNQSIRERLDGMTHRIGQTMTEQTRSTHENLAKLQERLAVIDTAQNNIQSLAGQVVQLQAILANKQTRGAFGQSRMEAIIADGLPQGAYEFQATLSNSTRPDCLVRMPNNAPSLVIDAKFPLEAWNSMRETEQPEARKAAVAQFRRDMEIHIKDVSDKYLIPGETQDTAFLFVPLGIDLCGYSRTFRGADPACAPGTGRHRLAVAADAVDSGHSGHPEGCPHARAGACHSGRGDPPDGRCRPSG